MGQGVTSGSADTYGYVLIGRCKAGLTAGDSQPSDMNTNLMSHL